MFMVSLGALSASLGSIGALFSIAYGLPKSHDMGRQIALEILELGDKAKSMTEDEWKKFATQVRAR